MVSLGGNDAIGASGLIDERGANVADAVEKLADIRDRFDHNYGTMIDLVLARRINTGRRSTSTTVPPESNWIRS